MDNGGLSPVTAVFVMQSIFRTPQISAQNMRLYQRVKI
ncbi:hypothetical protein CES86_1127 [Brucella lupini]|uniref:Uncharacterized protein n=1 Tax=Brucella lupini TaxID=255457 RepID=A0A256GWW4_9HYPH|nr:hypothetical protein CES86_1127 [Brucella lupini]